MPTWERYFHPIIQAENTQIHINHHIIIFELYFHIYIFFTCFDNIYIFTVFLLIDKLSTYNWTFILLQVLIIIDLYTLSSIVRGLLKVTMLQQISKSLCIPLLLVIWMNTLKNSRALSPSLILMYYSLPISKVMMMNGHGRPKKYGKYRRSILVRVVLAWNVIVELWW